MTYWNYCDYRCEDCEHLFECPVALKEREQEMRAIAEGREFDPMEAVKESLEETLEMVRKMAEERGIDLSSAKDEEIREYELPLVEKSKKFAIDVMGFAKEMKDRAFSEETQKAIYDLCWYAGLLSAKLYRCLSGKYEAMEQDDLELREIEIEDSRKTASVAAMAISKCKKALDSLLPEHLPEIQKFYTELRDIEKEFRAEFPEIAMVEKKQLH